MKIKEVILITFLKQQKMFWIDWRDILKTELKVASKVHFEFER